MNLRLFAARIIAEVSLGRSLSDRLNTELPLLETARDRAWVQAVCYGVCRYYPRLIVILSTLLKKPLPAKEKELQALLLVGLYQLTEMRAPDYAAVAETVNAAVELKKTWAKGLVNAVLREYLRKRDSIEEKIAAEAESHYAHPRWWMESLEQAWPAHWQDILLANNVHPPMALRVNQRHLTRAAYLDILKTQGHNASAIAATSCGVIVEPAIAAEALPGFVRGDVSVQDGAAQLAAPWLNLQPGLRVLDACAAPGGKLMHMLEMMPTLEVIAIEKDKQRLCPLEENLTRLQLTAECKIADAANIQAWWDGKLFDRILLDAPCSGSGVIRRHPDIKLLRKPSDIAAFAQEQLQLLSALWQVLAPDGLLLYATCSVLPEENTAVMAKFLSAHPDAKEDIIDTEVGLPMPIGRQILPGMQDMDGFYYARVKKTTKITL